MIRPIPKKMLPHKAIYKEYFGNNGEGDQWKCGVPLSFIKIEERTQIKVTSNGREIVGKARMFYDHINSVGFTEKPKENSIIQFNDRDYTIENVDSLCADDSTPHHYELLLK